MQNLFFKRSLINKAITLPVENINLSVNYYREYLGFQFISYEGIKNNIACALLKFDDQELILEQVISKEKFCSDKIDLTLNWDDKQLKQHYNELKQKVKVIKNYSSNKNGVSLFSILDCDGNILNFQTKIVNKN